MCGRFTLRTPLSKLLQQFELRTSPPVTPRYNIAPTQTVFAVRVTNPKEGREPVFLRWGLVPSWADDMAIGQRMINARGETVAEKPSFRSAFKARRCLIPADGYYEWQKTATGKVPHLIHLKNDEPFAMAGLWEQWRKGEGGQTLETCTIITTTASDVTRAIHDRMPVILAPADYDLWLDPTVQDRGKLEPLIAPYQSPDILVTPVSTHVNNPRHDDAQCVEPAPVK